MLVLLDEDADFGTVKRIFDLAVELGLNLTGKAVFFCKTAPRLVAVDTPAEIKCLSELFDHLDDWERLY